MVVDFDIISSTTIENIFSLVPEVSDYKVSLENTFDVIRLDFGKYEIKSYLDKIINVYNMKFILENKEERNYLLNFFNTVKGNLKGFWIPTYTPELEYLSNTDVEYLFKDNNFRYVYNGYEKLGFFDYKNNKIQIRDIVDSYIDTDNNFIIKVNNLFDLSENYRKYIFFRIVYVRFISNSLKLSYSFNVMNNMIASINLSFKELPTEV